jgi:hypothetical protein
MTLVFSGVLAAVFYTLVFGAVWPARDGADFSVAMLGQIAKSLWLSWLVVVVSYWLNLTIPLPALLSAVMVALAYQWLRRERYAVLTNTLPMTLVLIITAGLCLFLYFGGFDSDYRLVFMTTDALASWNRWAIELSKNTYAPSDAAYPLLFSGIWSLVYKAQGASTVWIFAKLTMFVGPVILAGTVCVLFASRAVIAASIYSVFVFQFFFVSKAFPMLLGNMDVPVAIMCLAAGILMVVAIDKIERNEPTGEVVILAALFAGLASITKQWGAVTLLPLLYLVCAGVWRGKIGKLDGLTAVAVAGIPLATFMAMFLSQRLDPFGSLENLQNITKTVNKIPLLGALHHVEAMLPVWMLAVLLLLTLANLFYLRRLSGQMGILFLVLGIAGFFVFAKCCSYDERNGWWIISLLATSAMFSVARIDPSKARALVVKTPAHYLPMAVAALAVLSASMVSDRISGGVIASIQFHEQEKIPGPYVGPMLTKVLQPVLNQGDVLLSEYENAKWYPGMIGNFRFCVSSDKLCIRKVFNDPAHGRVFVLVQPGLLEYPPLSALLTADRLMAASGGFELYGPFQAADVNLVK